MNQTYISTRQRRRASHGSALAWSRLQVTTVLFGFTWFMCYTFIMPYATRDTKLQFQRSDPHALSHFYMPSVVHRKNMTRVNIVLQQRLQARRKVSSRQKGARGDPRDAIAVCTVLHLSRRRDLQRLVNSIDATVTELELVTFRFTLFVGYKHRRRLVLKLISPEWLEVKYTSLRQKEELPVNGVVSDAFRSEVDYVVYVPPHAEFIGVGWASLGVQRLRAHVPANFGVVVLSDVDYEYEGILVHSTHQSIFHRLYFRSSATDSLKWYASVYNTNQSSVMPGLCIVSSRAPVYSTGTRPIEPVVSLTAARENVQRLAIYREVAEEGFGVRDSGVVLAFRRLQEEYARKLAERQGSKFTNVNMLVVMSVSSRAATVENVAEWLGYFGTFRKKQQRGPGKSDRVEFLFNHYEPITSAWKRLKRNHRRSIRSETYQLRCKLELWKKLNSAMTQLYDYVWLVDEDMDISLFSWELTRALLRNLEPMVAAPGVVPVSKFGRRSIWEVTHMQASYIHNANEIVLARNAWFAEAMVPLISTQFWPLVYNRLEGWDTSGLYCIDCFWSHAANRWGGKVCGLKAPLIIMDITPLVHLDKRTMGELTTVDARKSSGCRRSAIKNNRRLSAFPTDILFPTNASRSEDKSAATVLKTIVAPAVACPHTSEYHKSSEWSIDSL